MGLKAGGKEWVAMAILVNVKESIEIRQGEPQLRDIFS